MPARAQPFGCCWDSNARRGRYRSTRHESQNARDGDSFASRMHRRCLNGCIHFSEYLRSNAFQNRTDYRCHSSFAFCFRWNYPAERSVFDGRQVASNWSLPFLRTWIVQHRKFRTNGRIQFPPDDQSRSIAFQHLKRYLATSAFADLDVNEPVLESDDIGNSTRHSRSTRSHPNE